MGIHVVASVPRVTEALTSAHLRTARCAPRRTAPATKDRGLLAAFASLALVTTVLVVGAAPAAPAAAAALANAGSLYVTLSGSPGMPEFDPANGTLYVPVQ